MTIARFSQLLLAGIVAMVATVSLPASGQPAGTDAALRAIDDQLRTGRFVEAATAARQLVESLDATGAGETLAMADALDRLVEAMVNGQSEFAQAIGPAERAVALKERLLGPDDPERSRSLVNLAQVEDLRSNFRASLSAAELGLSLARRAWPADDPRVSWALTWVAFGHYRTADYVRAELESRAAIEAMERTLAPDDPRLARAFHNYGLLLGVLARYEEARAALERGLRIREAAYGPDALLVANSANGLGNVLTQMGDLLGAREALNRTLAIRERALPSDHWMVGQTRRLYAQLLEQLGDYEGARVAFERAMAVFANSSERAAERALTTFRYARVLGRLERLEEARAGFQRAVPMMEAAYGPRNPYVAQSLADYANVLEEIGQPAAALEPANRALEIRRQLTADSPTLITSLQQVARLRAALGDLQSPRVLYEEMLSLYQRGENLIDPNVGYGRADYASYLLRVGDEASAFDQAVRAARAGRTSVRQIVRALPEREAILFTSSQRFAIEVALLVAEQARSLEPDAAAALFDVVIGSRAMVLDEMAARRRVLNEAPGVAALRGDVEQARARLAHIVVQGQEDLRRTVYAKLVADASDRKDKAEARLALESAPFRAERQAAAAGLAEVQTALPAGSALVSFVTYQARSAEARYGAFVLQAGTAGPRFVALGPAATIDAAVDATRAQLLREANAPGVSPIRTERQYRESASALRKLVWDPLSAAIGASRRIFVVGDGALNLVNFSALPDGASGYLIDRGFVIHYLSAERDLVAAPVRRNAGLLAVGNPAFDRRIVADAKAPATGVQRGVASPCIGLAGMRFDPLPAAAAEAADLARLWGRLGARRPGFGPTVRLNLGDATEEEFKSQAPGQRVLHLATHGFALLDGCRGGRDDRAWSRLVQQNPLLLSGLAFAGANQRQQAESANEDGILTAEEIASLDLEGVEWAVLSGCGTGLGAIRAGEGVFGLRRAFRIAGAATVIMSLWPIDDEDTRRWVDNLYGARFADQRTTMDAVWQSSIKALRHQRTAGASTHPYYWAGFVAVGDWR